MDATWFARRAALHCLSRDHPDWTYAHLAATVSGSESFVKKWLARFKQATATDWTLYQSRSHARHTPPPSTPRPVVERILALRDEPPAHLRRVPGPRTIIAFLHLDPEALALGVPLPRSTHTVWKVLHAHRRIANELPHQHQPLVPSRCGSGAECLARVGAHPASGVRAGHFEPTRRVAGICLPPLVGLRSARGRRGSAARRVAQSDLRALTL